MAEDSGAPPESKFASLGAPVLLAAAVCLVASFAAITETDAGWHLALGRLLLRGQFPHTNALSWVSGELPWYPTSWLYDALLAAADRALPGALGLQLVTFALALAAAALLALACAEEDRYRGAWVVPAAMLLVLPRITERPHVASWAVLCGVLALCLAARRQGPRLRAWALLVLAVGGNLHTGAVFAAFVLVAFSAEAFMRDLRREDLAIGLVAGPAAVLANPGGLFDLRYLLDHLHVQSVVRLVEFEPPTFAHEPMFFALLAFAGALSLWRIRNEPALCTCVLIFGAMGLRTVRMVYEFELVAAPMLAWALAVGRYKRGAWLANVQAGALIGCALLAAHPRDLAARALGLGARWDEHALPVRAAAFLDAQHLEARGYNGLRDGGYLAAARPGVPIFIDGRVQAYPPELFAELQAAEASRAKFQALLRARGVEWALTTRLRERLGGFGLLEGPQWALVYWDDTNAVYVRRDVERLAPIVAALEYRYFAPVGAIVGGVAALPQTALPALEAEVRRFSLTSPGDPFAALVECAVSSRESRPDAEAICDDARARAPNDAVRALVARARGLRKP